MLNNWWDLARQFHLQPFLAKKTGRRTYQGGGRLSVKSTVLNSSEIRIESFPEWSRFSQMLKVHPSRRKPKNIVSPINIGLNL